MFNSAPYIVTMATTNLAITDLDLFNNTIFTVTNKIRRNHQCAEINAIFKKIVKNDHYKDKQRCFTTTNKRAYNRKKNSQQN